MRGLERGIERVIGKPGNVTYVEIEAFIIFNLVRQMEQGLVDPAPVWTDLKTFDPQPFQGKIHGIIGGYPCQPFSVAGKLGGANDPRHLWPYIERHIRTIKPIWCFFENVANHLDIGYREVRQSLESMGYRVKEGIYTAEEVGAPHKRERLFILAIMVDPGSQQSRTGYKEICRAYEEISKRDNNAQFIQSGETMADTNSNGDQKGLDARGIAENTGGIEGQTQEREWIWDELDASSETMADPLRTNSGKVQTERNNASHEWESLRNGYQWGCGWPAGQGQYQHPWEEPRTIEPGVGCTVNGYDFTTDLLRMYGNGVVEQTAALAFTDLLRKHYENK